MSDQNQEAEARAMSWAWGFLFGAFAATVVVSTAATQEMRRLENVIYDQRARSASLPDPEWNESLRERRAAHAHE